MSEDIEIKQIGALYKKGSSSAEIGKDLSISWRRVIYLMEKYNIRRRSRSEATYRKLNPDGDPFEIKENLNEYEKQLKIFALGLYLGEGRKSNSISVRLSNSNSEVINIFLKFLKNICGVKTQKIKLWFTLHSGTPVKQAEQFWSQKLNIPISRFSKPVIVNHRGNGTYRKKCPHGTATICVYNMKLGKILQNWIKKIVKQHAQVAQSLPKASRNLPIVESRNSKLGVIRTLE